jgi:hypothetical protein
MKKLLAVISLVLATQAHAQIAEVNKKVICSNLVNIAEMLVKSEERLIWQGKDSGSGNIISVFINKKDNSWTVIESNKDIGCILGVGEEFQIKWQPSSKSYL